MSKPFEYYQKGLHILCQDLMDNKPHSHVCLVQENDESSEPTCWAFGLRLSLALVAMVVLGPRLAL